MSFGFYATSHWVSLMNERVFQNRKKKEEEEKQHTGKKRNKKKRKANMLEKAFKSICNSKKKMAYTMVIKNLVMALKWMTSMRQMRWGVCCDSDMTKHICHYQFLVFFLFPIFFLNFVFLIASQPASNWLTTNMIMVAIVKWYTTNNTQRCDGDDHQTNDTQTNDTQTNSS